MRRKPRIYKSPLNAREKVIEAERQIRCVIAGTSKEIHCPFCGETSTAGQELLCCENLCNVVNAVLDYVDTRANLEVVDRVMDRLAGQSQAVLN